MAASRCCFRFRRSEWRRTTLCFALANLIVLLFLANNIFTSLFNTNAIFSSNAMYYSEEKLQVPSLRYHASNVYSSMKKLFQSSSSTNDFYYSSINSMDDNILKSGGAFNNETSNNNTSSPDDNNSSSSSSTSSFFYFGSSNSSTVADTSTTNKNNNNRTTTSTIMIQSNNTNNKDTMIDISVGTTTTTTTTTPLFTNKNRASSSSSFIETTPIIHGNNNNNNNNNDTIYAAASSTITSNNSSTTTANNNTILPVYLIPSAKSIHSQGEHNHFIVDGVIKSPHLRLIRQHDNFTFGSSIWIMDMRRIIQAGGCEKVLVPELQKAFFAAKATTTTSATVSAVIQELYFVDWSDGPVIRNFEDCIDEILKFNLTKQQIHFAKRSTVRWRHVIGNQTHFIEIKPGKRMDPKYIIPTFSRNPQVHMPYGVRSDYYDYVVQHIRKQLHVNYDINPSDNHYKNAFMDKLFNHSQRSIDISHFWPLKRVEDGKIHNTQSVLRYSVSRAIVELEQDYNTHHSSNNNNSTNNNNMFGKQNNNNTTISITNNKNITTFVGVTGNAGGFGRKQLQRKYVETMLQSKIIVVSQRDGHEDHYRLMEGLVTGALVFTDKMVSLPEGLQGGVVEYTNMHELKQQLVYYLQQEQERVAIARQGFRVATSQYRSYQMVEQLLFGQVLTP